MDKAPPSVHSHPLAGKTRFDSRMPQKTEGRFPLVLEVMERMKQAVGRQTALYGLVTGPFTLAFHLRGVELFMDINQKPAFFRELIAYCTQVAKSVSAYYIEAGMDVIALVDPLVSQVSPVMFEQFLAIGFSEIFTTLRRRSVYSSFFVCGNASKSIEAMCQTGPDCISVDENVNMVAARQITERYNIILSGNIPLTSVMLLKGQKDNQKFAVDLIDQMGPDNFILAPGCDMPYDVPKENLIGIAQAVQNLPVTRDYLKQYQVQSIAIDVEMPDYQHLERPLVEVFTLDSSTCAACSAMKLAAEDAVRLYNGSIDVLERKITRAENIVRAQRLELTNLPAIVINGILIFNSLVPSRTELQAELEKVL
jgi:uroporphyrinogen decarboxylase